MDQNTIMISGVAIIHARPHRTPRIARQFADRIAANPEDYLSVVNALAVPGITDIRPWYVTSGASPATTPTRAIHTSKPMVYAD